MILAGGGGLKAKRRRTSGGIKQGRRVINQWLLHTCKTEPSKWGMVTPTWVKASTRLAFPSPRYFHFLCLRLNRRGVRQSAPAESSIAPDFLQQTKITDTGCSRSQRDDPMHSQHFSRDINTSSKSRSVTQLSVGVSCHSGKQFFSCARRLGVAKLGEILAQLVTHRL